MENILVVPDVHAGFNGFSRVNELVDTLRTQVRAMDRPRLVFIGDVLDLWRASPEDALAEAKPLFSLVDELMSEEDITAADYIVGNHDYHLLVDLESGDRNILDRMPSGIQYFHRYRGLAHNGKRILLAHGDDYDFLYITLEELDPLTPGDLRAEHVYMFYEWMFHLDKQLLASLQKQGIRGFFLAWLKEVVKSEAHVPPALSTSIAISEAAKAISTDRVVARYVTAASNAQALFDVTGSQPTRSTAGPSTIMNLFSLQSWLSRFFAVSLFDIANRTGPAQTWADIANYSPYDSRVPIQGFKEFDHIVVGHFHDPRQTPGISVTDSGSWVDDPEYPGRYGTLVEIANNRVSLTRRATVVSSQAL